MIIEYIENSEREGKVVRGKILNEDEVREHEVAEYIIPLYWWRELGGRKWRGTNISPVVRESIIRR